MFFSIQGPAGEKGEQGPAGSAGFQVGFIAVSHMESGSEKHFIFVTITILCRVFLDPKVLLVRLASLVSR